MISLLVAVFLIQLIIHIISTIGAPVINELLWALYNRLPFASSANTYQEQTRLRGEVLRLKREMNAISAQDDFVRWAKLRRQHDKAMEQHDEKGKSASQMTTSIL